MTGSVGVAGLFWMRARLSLASKSASKRLCSNCDTSEWSTAELVISTVPPGSTKKGSSLGIWKICFTTSTVSA